MNVKKKNSLLLVFIIFLTSFLLWVIFCLKITNYSQSNLLKNYYNIPFINLNGLKQEEELDLSKYWLVYEIMKNNYYDWNLIDNNKLVEKSIKWLVNWLNDRHSEYLDKEENTLFNNSLNWDFEWIWAVVKTHVLGVEVDRLIKGSPALEVDIRAWDIIISASGESLEWKTVTEAVNFIKWNAWTKVDLEIIRVGELEILKKSVIRDKIKIPSLSYELIENSIWYISLNLFWDDTSSEFEKALYELRNTKWIVIDLRDNWGWYLLSAVEVLSNFIKKWERLVVTKYKDDKINEYYNSINNWNLYKWKIVILINENSASASEIVAWTLKEYDIAIVVWKKSYWKGSVQKPYELPDGSMIKLTIAKWFTPKWVNIDEEWINPDIEINYQKEDYENLYDRQYEESINILKKFIQLDSIEETKKFYTN